MTTLTCVNVAIFYIISWYKLYGFLFIYVDSASFCLIKCFVATILCMSSHSFSFQFYLLLLIHLQIYFSLSLLLLLCTIMSNKVPAVGVIVVIIIIIITLCCGVLFTQGIILQCRPRLRITRYNTVYCVKANCLLF